MQVTEKKSELAKLEAIDCGKPLDEAAWDMVCVEHFHFFVNVACSDWCRVPAFKWEIHIFHD